MASYSFKVEICGVNTSKLPLLTDEEKKRLANFPVGHGLFFAGPNHVHIQIIASATEESLITTRPGDKQ